ncbi:MAG: hypothetical protein RLZ68_2117 [Pseudomonadota bacterium]
MEQHKIRIESCCYRSLLEIAPVKFPNARKIWRIATAIAGSLALHGILGWWLYAYFAKYQVPSQRALRHHILRFDMAPPHTSVKKEHSLREHVEINSDQPTPADPVNRHSSDPPLIQLPNATQVLVEVMHTVNNKFLSIDEVDTPAMPVGEWVIDFSELPPGRISGLVIEMWISAAGKLEHWELVGDLANRELIKRSLRQLAATPINPALLNGRSVASFRRIEILIDIEP